MMDLNVAPVSSPNRRQQSSDQPSSSSDQQPTSSELCAADERTQLFTVTKPKKKQLPEDTSETPAAGEDVNKTSELPIPANNIADDVVQSTVKGEDSVSDDEEEIFDIN